MPVVGVNLIDCFSSTYTIYRD
jgi:hypothetical protein